MTGGRQARLAPDALLLGASIAVVAVLVKLVWPRFTWFGDNAESFFPLWHMVGSGLREGRWLGFDPTAFAGGNTVGEANYGLFNPATLANALLVSGFDELARASFLVTTEFLILLGLAVRSLALSYGARPAAGFTAGLIIPFSGFTLYWVQATGSAVSCRSPGSPGPGGRHADMRRAPADRYPWSSSAAWRSPSDIPTPCSVSSSSC